MSYRGPNVSVRQQFELSPPAVAIDNLAPVSIGTAYDVYSKELLDSSVGLDDVIAGWIGENPVVYNRDVAGDRVFDFYPSKVFVQTDDFGTIEITDDVTLSTSGASIPAKATYNIPGASAAVGLSKAYMPYYKNITDGIAAIAASSLDKVILNGVNISGANLVQGQRVFLTINNSEGKTAGDYEIGTVSAILQNGTVIKLASAYSAALLATEVDAIYVGAASTASLDTPNTVYDPSVNFTNLFVKSGDVIEFEANALAATGKASVFSVINANTLFISTEAAADWTMDIKKVFNFTDATLGGTAKLSEYKISRLVGFSKNLNFEGAGGFTASGATSSSVNIAKNVNTSALKVGDKVAFTVADVNADPADGFLEITDIIDNGATYTLNLDGNPGSVNAQYVTAWTTIVSNDILADYRAIRAEENLVRHRITGPADITNFYSKDENISVYNDLAMMLLIQLSIGGSAVYGVNVNSASDNLAGEYAAALDEMKMVDVYSHAIGTTDPGVNALMGPYCDAEAAPYQAHERVAILGYDQLDVFNIGVDTVNSATTAAVLTVDGALDLLANGVTAGDDVLGYDAAGALIVEGKVTLTPSTSTTVSVDSNFTSAVSVKFLRGGRQAKAEAIRNIRYGNRRIKAIWPGWFQADFNGETLENVPPYYIAAAITGYDSLVNPSQSLTRFNFGIPGFSNYKLETNFYFWKDELDVIGGGGIDILVQDSQVSQSIYSRHSLTSNMDAIEYREWSITKQADVAAKTFRTAFAPYPGKYNITPALIEFLQTIGDAVSRKLGDSGDKIVYTAKVTSITRDTEIKDKINILIDITVYVAGNYYDITLNIKS